MIHSAHQRRAIRNLTRLAKSLNPLMTRIPNYLPGPGSQSYLAAQGQDTKERERRQAEWSMTNARRLDKSTIRFFAERMGFERR